MKYKSKRNTYKHNIIGGAPLLCNTLIMADQCNRQNHKCIWEREMCNTLPGDHCDEFNNERTCRARQYKCSWNQAGNICFQKPEYEKPNLEICYKCKTEFDESDLVCALCPAGDKQALHLGCLERMFLENIMLEDWPQTPNSIICNLDTCIQMIRGAGATYTKCNTNIPIDTIKHLISGEAMQLMQQIITVYSHKPRILNLDPFQAWLNDNNAANMGRGTPGDYKMLQCPQCGHLLWYDSCENLQSNIQGPNAGYAQGNRCVGILPDGNPCNFFAINTSFWIRNPANNGLRSPYQQYVQSPGVTNRYHPYINGWELVQGSATHQYIEPFNLVYCIYHNTLTGETTRLIPLRSRPINSIGVPPDIDLEIARNAYYRWSDDFPGLTPEQRDAQINQAHDVRLHNWTIERDIVILRIKACLETIDQRNELYNQTFFNEDSEITQETVINYKTQIETILTDKVQQILREFNEQDEDEQLELDQIIQQHDEAHALQPEEQHPDLGGGKHKSKIRKNKQKIIYKSKNNN